MVELRTFNPMVAGSNPVTSTNRNEVQKMKVWEVGGCVRDQMMGNPSNDVDFAVEAKS